MRYLSALSLLAYAGSLMGQQFVSTEPQLKNIVIEEFTGIYCGYCPDGAAKVQAIIDKYPTRSMSVGIHSSAQYSQPQSGSGHPDFRTAFGPSLQSLSGLTGFPAGMLNRRLFPGMSQCCDPNYSTSLAMNRNYWMTAADAIIDEGENSPVNIGLRTTWTESTRQLNIEVELYYTASEATEDRLHVMLSENHITGYQGGSGGGNNYDHKHVLRDVPSGYIGELVSTTSVGSVFAKSYSLTVPSGWDINNCEVIAFVTKATKKDTHTGVEVAALNGSTAIDNIAPSDIAMSVYPNPSQGSSRLQFSISESADVEVEVLNLIGEIVSEPFTGYVQASRSQVIDLVTDDLKAGIYFVRIQVGQTAKTVKLHILN